MITFIAQYTYKDDEETTAGRVDLAGEHVQFLNSLVEGGRLMLAGRWGPSDPPGGQLVLQAVSAQEARSVVEGDPYVRSGFVSELRVIEWQVPLGRAAYALNGGGEIATE